MVGITTQPYPLLWTACVLPQVGLLACRRLGALPFPPPTGTACVPEAGGRGVVCAARKARNLPPSPLDCLRPATGRTACVPEAGGRGVVCAARKARNLPPSPLDCLHPAAGRTACVPEAGGRLFSTPSREGAGGWCAQPEKHEICRPLLWTACVPEAGGRGVAAGNPHTSTTTLLV